MNYYNDNSPEACAWLRELIAARQIPAGHVDCRSITDVQPGELAGYRQCHFFAGIGGWAYALRLAGWPDDEPVWTGSCPCQPLSCAGQRKGHADERHLWPAFYRLISECKPATVFGEQVAGKDGREWLAGVRADLEGAGYACGATDLCAASVGAPHRRQRLFWVAHNLGAGLEERTGQSGNSRQEQPAAERDCAIDSLENADHAERRAQHGPGEDGRDGQDSGRQEAHGESGARSQVCAVDNSPSARRDRQEQEPESDSRNEARLRVPSAGSGLDCVGDTEVSGQPGLGLRRDGESEVGTAETNAGAMGDAASGGCGVGGDAAQPGNCGHVVSPSWSRFETVLCRDGKTRRFESGSFPLVAGLPGGVVPSGDPSREEAQATAEARVMRLRGYGNSIVAQVAAEFIMAAVEAINP